MQQNKAQHSMTEGSGSLRWQTKGSGERPLLCDGYLTTASNQVDDIWPFTFVCTVEWGRGGGEAHRQIGVWDLGEVIQAGVEALPGTRPTHLVVSKPLHRDVYFWKVFYYASARFAWNKSSQVSLNLQRPQTLAILASMHLNLHLQSGFRPILIGWFPLASHHLFCLEWWNVGKEVRLRRKQELPVPSCSEKKHPRKRAW